MRRRRGVTQADVVAMVASIAALVFLVWLIMPCPPHPPGESYQTVCMRNLKEIGKAFRDYAAENGGKFPRAHTEGDPLAAPTPDNNLQSISTNAMNQVWVMIEEGLLPAGPFNCPADERWTHRTSDVKYGWEKASEFSYGIQYPFDHDPAGEAANPACPAAADYRSDWILMADRNPGKRVTSDKDWPNHPDGCAYLKMDGSVFFHEGSNSVVSGQEIYGDDNAADGNIFPDSAGDVVIVPDAPGD